jgi:hypothetical protein
MFNKADIECGLPPLSISLLHDPCHNWPRVALAWSPEAHVPDRYNRSDGTTTK